jgi:prophage regulatory protein
MTNNIQTITIERLPAVIERTGLGRSSIYAAIARGDFPQPVKLSARAVGFVSAEIDQWIAGRAARRAD